jgi:hypothetical protein
MDLPDTVEPCHRYVLLHSRRYSRHPRVCQHVRRAFQTYTTLAMDRLGDRQDTMHHHLGSTECHHPGSTDPRLGSMDLHHRALTEGHQASMHRRRAITGVRQVSEGDGQLVCNYLYIVRRFGVLKDTREKAGFGDIVGTL